MKKLSLLFAAMLVLAACGEEAATGDEEERKENITNDETMSYFEQLLQPYIQLTDLETEEQAIEAIEDMDATATEVKRELKRDYEQDINAVDDLTALSDIYSNLAKDVEDGNLHLLQAYGNDIGAQVRVIATEYLDGELPANYAEVIGVDNIYDLD